MVDTQDIYILQSLFHTGDPPCKVCFFMLFPVIVRVAPQLACFAEIIGGHTCDTSGETFRVQTEQFLIRPYIGTVIGYENRCIADDGDAFFIGIFFYCLPLFCKDILQESFLFDGFCKEFFPFFQHHGVAFFDGSGEGYPVGTHVVVLQLFFCQFHPFTFGNKGIKVFCAFFVHAFCTEMFFQGKIEGIILQPESIFLAESVEVSRFFSLSEVLICLFEKGQFRFPCFSVIHAFGGCYCGLHQICRCQQTIFHQFFRADEKDIACKGGTAGIRGAAVICWYQRQHLPQSLACISQFIDECVCRLTQIAYAEGRRQGSGMQQHTAFSFCHIKTLLMIEMINFQFPKHLLYQFFIVSTRFRGLKHRHRLTISAVCSSENRDSFLQKRENYDGNPYCKRK